jgi:hypothetical protein
VIPVVPLIGTVRLDVAVIGKFDLRHAAIAKVDAALFGDEFGKFDTLAGKFGDFRGTSRKRLGPALAIGSRSGLHRGNRTSPNANASGLKGR